MSAYDSADLLARLRTQLRRPATDETLTDPMAYQALTDAQQALYGELMPRCPDAMVGPLVALTSLDGGLTFPFGNDSAGNPIYPMGHVGIYASPNDVPDNPWSLNVDYLGEGDHIRIPNGGTYAGPLYWRGVLPPAPISASSAPSLQPAASRVLLVYWAAAEYAGWGDLKDPTSYQAKFDRGFAELCLRLRTQFRLGSATRILSWCGGSSGTTSAAPHLITP